MGSVHVKITRVNKPSESLAGKTVVIICVRLDIKQTPCSGAESFVSAAGLVTWPTKDLQRSVFFFNSQSIPEIDQRTGSR